MPSEISVAGVVLADDHGRFLLVQESRPKVYGKWNLPAGHVDPGETPQQAAIREAQEEVGLHVKLLRDEPLLIGEDPGSHRVLAAYLGIVTGGELRAQPEEILDARWFSYEEIEALNESDSLRVPWVLESVRAAHDL